MNANECYSLLEGLNIDLLSSTSRGYLDRSCQACKMNDKQSMLELAQCCLSVTLECKDQAGQAAAQIHLGMAYALQEEFDEAVQNCLDAKRIYHRSPDQRYNEGTVAYGLGLIYQQRDSSSKAISYYEEAIGLLRQARNNHAATGNKKQFAFIQMMSDKIEQRIASLLDT